MPWPSKKIIRQYCASWLAMPTLSINLGHIKHWRCVTAFAILWHTCWYCVMCRTWVFKGWVFLVFEIADVSVKSVAQCECPFFSMGYQRKEVEDKPFELAWMATSHMWKDAFEHKVNIQQACRIDMHLFYYTCVSQIKDLHAELGELAKT